MNKYVNHIIYFTRIEINIYTSLIKSYKNNPIGVYCMVIDFLTIAFHSDYFHKYYYKTMFWHKLKSNLLHFCHKNLL